MDSLITAAAAALARGDVLGALNRVALRADPAALALRGIALAQLGELIRARALLRQATRSFGRTEAIARARCVLAEAEIALAARDLAWPAKALREAATTLRRGGDLHNAFHARHLEVRRLLLLGHLEEAEQQLRPLARTALPASLQAVQALLSAGIAVRRLQIARAQREIERATAYARASGISALSGEIQTLAHALDQPAARLWRNGTERMLRLFELEAVHRSEALVVDGTRQEVRCRSKAVSLRRRPVLWKLVTLLAHAAPDEVSRRVLVSKVFRQRHIDETHRARLRVEVGRLRRELCGIARIVATDQGFALQPGAAEILVLSLPLEDPHALVLARLADGESWSSSALALALGVSQRSVQRLLDTLAAEGRARSTGRGRAQRWTAPPLPGITTMLLLPGPLPGT